MTDSAHDFGYDSAHDPDAAPDGLTTPQSRELSVRPGASSAAYIDYEFAKWTGRTVVNPGPQVTSDEAAEIVADLRDAAAEAEEPVAETSRLRAPDGAPPPLVVDRAGWISANVDSFKAMIDPVVDKLVAKRKSAGEPDRRWRSAAR